MQASPSGVELKTKYFILNFLIIIFPLVVMVDGQRVAAKWGSTFIPLAPGNHEITVSWKLYWVIPVNKATMQVGVGDGALPVVYTAPWLFILPGKIGPG